MNIYILYIGLKLTIYLTIEFSLNVLDPNKCGPLETIKKHLPDDLWSTSGFDENDTLEMGKTIQFRCPNGTALSFDRDNFDPFDDRCL